MGVESSPPRTVFKHDHAFTAEPAAGAQAGASTPRELVQAINDQNAVNTAVLVLAAFWVIASASAAINKVRAGAKAAALLWALSFTGACLVVFYLIWSLV